MKKRVFLLLIAAAAFLMPQFAYAQDGATEAAAQEKVVTNSAAPTAVRLNDSHEKHLFYFFYRTGCPHCKEAHPYVNELKDKYPDITFKEINIMDSEENLELLRKTARELKLESLGVPLFVMDGKSVVGFQKGQHEKLIEEMITEHFSDPSTDACEEREKKTIQVPFLGQIDPHLVSLPSFTFVIGLLDGINPCAMWVLMFLLTLLVNAKSRRKVVLIGSIFVLSSAVVYFLFMTAWLNIFTFLGVSPYVSIGLGIVAVTMGLINAKEFFFFKKGVSLMIPESQKPKLFKKMRAIMNSKSGIFSILGTIALAFFVNLIELGCTVGLPAIYTKVLTTQHIGTATKYFYMMLYNLYYVIPLAIIVAGFAFTMGRFKLEEKHARWLKLVSGTLMVTLGLILIIKPDLLVFG